MSDPAKIAQTGIKSVTRDLSVTANNLANSQTMGFKKSNVNFSELYIQGSGLGVAVDGVKTDFSTGTIVTTGRYTDVAIQDDSFFMFKKDGSGEQNFYGKVGSFDIDKNGNMVTAQGWKVQGFKVDEQTGKASQIAASMTIPRVYPNPLATSNLSVEMTLDASTAIGESVEVTSTIYDSLGKQHIIESVYTKTADNVWQVSYNSPENGITAPVPPASGGTITFDAKGNVDPANTSLTAIDFDFANGSNPGQVMMDLGSTTQTFSEFTLWDNEADGYATGNLVGLTIDDGGNVQASYSNGKTINQYKVALARFAALDGLTQSDGGLYQESLNSGKAVLGSAGNNGFATLGAGMLEGSNVDMGAELIHMVEVERAFEANTKVLQLTKQLDRKILEL